MWILRVIHSTMSSSACLGLMVTLRIWLAFRKTRNRVACWVLMTALRRILLVIRRTRTPASGAHWVPTIASKLNGFSRSRSIVRSASTSMLSQDLRMVRAPSAVGAIVLTFSIVSRLQPLWQVRTILLSPNRLLSLAPLGWLQSAS